MKNDVWLFSDLDGTLLPSDKQIPDDLRDSIQQFVQQGGHFTIATGRTIESARTYWEQLSVKEPMILFNGAMIYDPVSEQILYQQPLCASAREMAAAVLKEFPQAGSEILCADGTYVIQNTIYEQQHVAICQVLVLIGTVSFQTVAFVAHGRGAKARTGAVACGGIKRCTV